MCLDFAFPFVILALGFGYYSLKTPIRELQFPFFALSFMMITTFSALALAMAREQATQDVINVFETVFTISMWLLFFILCSTMILIIIQAKKLFDRIVDTIKNRRFSARTRR